jgi:isopentenyl-diphosphate delta-isomerase type 1
MAEWKGEGSQDALMQSDECIVVDDKDRVSGHMSKALAHTFTVSDPRGHLHRAFSVFLFDSSGRLLLQQRAANKITFPNVWTNTCCSHPLWPSEVDTDADILDGSVPGVKAAAVRKLLQELGIESKDVPTDQFKYLTRLHYWAADTVTHGADSPWGEHEIDYILFIQTDVQATPNPDEVQAIKYVTQQELTDMMTPSNGLLWSPWFRIIATTFLSKWWEDLSITLSTDKYIDLTTIHCFDPAEEHMGGKGNAGALLGKASYKNTDLNGNTVRYIYYYSIYIILLLIYNLNIEFKTRCLR